MGCAVDFLVFWDWTVCLWSPVVLAESGIDRRECVVERILDRCLEYVGEFVKILMILFEGEYLLVSFEKVG